MRPAERAMAGVDPQLADFGLPDIRDVGGRSGAQAGPKIGCATFTSLPRVADTGQHLLNTMGQHGAAGFGQWCGQAQVIAADFNGAGHAQIIAQPGHGAFDFVVNHADERGSVGLEQLESGAVALARVDWQIHADSAQQRCAN